MLQLLPNTQGIYHKAMVQKWAKIETISAGEDAIKAAGEIYLPKLSGQNQVDYDAYKSRGAFFNAFGRTTTGLTGAIIRKEPTIKTNPTVDNLLPSITLAGESIQEVIRMVTQDVISFGYYGILVDMPPVAEGVVSMANPYFAMYSAGSILNFETVQEGSENKLIMLALAEKVYKKNPENPFELVAIDQVRVLAIEDGILVVRVYQKDMNETRQELWKQIDEDIFPKIRGKNVDFIPFVFFGAVSNNPVPTEPPLMDLANLNIKHWQVTVDYYHGLHYCAMPTPWASGFPSSTELYIGAQKAWISEDPGAQCGFLEFTGQGLSAIVAALDKLEFQMVIMGARMLEEQKKAAEAAETVQMRYSGDTATLSSIVTSVEQGILKAIDLVGKWLGVEANTEVHLNRDFVAARLSAGDITALLQTWMSGGCSIDTFLYNLQAGEVLPADVTIEQEKKKIKAEAPAPPPEPPPSPFDGTGGTMATK
jgi:hypothetical protein